MSEKKSVNRMGGLSSLYVVVDGKTVPIVATSQEKTTDAGQKPESKAK